jgi:tetratricopeptide (TPR) repeat protein
MRMLANVRRMTSVLIAVSLAVIVLADGCGASQASISSLLRKAQKEFFSGDFASASGRYAELLERDLTYLQLREVLVSFCESTLREGKLAEAESISVKATQRLTDSPGMERIGFLRGEIYYFSGRIEEAIEEYLAFLEVNPESPRVNDVIARLLVMDENTDHERLPLRAYSYAEFLCFAEMGDSALVVLDTLLSVFPGAQISDDAVMKKGDVLRTQKKFVEALAQYDSLEARFPESHLVPVCKLKAAETYVRELRDKERAIAEYEEIVTGFPETSFAVRARNLLHELTEE